MFARNVKKLTLHNVRLEVNNPDLRPVVVLENVEDAAMTGMAVQGNAQAESALRVINSKDILLSSPRLLAAGSTFMQVEGEKSGNIVVDGGDISKAARPLAFAAGAAEKSVKLRA